MKIGENWEKLRKDCRKIEEKIDCPPIIGFQSREIKLSITIWPDPDRSAGISIKSINQTKLHSSVTILDFDFSKVPAGSCEARKPRSVNYSTEPICKCLKCKVAVPWQSIIHSYSAVTRIRTWVVSATTRSTNHYTITAIAPPDKSLAFTTICDLWTTNYVYISNLFIWYSPAILRFLCAQTHDCPPFPSFHCVCLYLGFGQL